MRFRTSIYLAAFALAVSACSEVQQPLGPEQQELAPFHVALGASAIHDSYIVVLNPGADARGVAATAGAQPEFVYSTALNGFSATLTAQAVNALRRNPNVAYIEMDQIVALAPPCGTPNGGPCDPDGDADAMASQVTPWGVKRVNGGATYSGSNVAWVIDTGIDLDHPDLNVNVGRSANFVPRGKNSPDDGQGHGTHVAGTIGAIDNSIDVVGVAAGATVIAIRVLDNSGSGSYSWVIAGVDHVAANGASGDVANMSLGGPPSSALDDAVKRAAKNGIRFTLAAGNSGADANNYSPARVNGTGIYTISRSPRTTASRRGRTGATRRSTTRSRARASCPRRRAAVPRP
jgi:hypothetical protein